MAGLSSLAFTSPWLLLGLLALPVLWILLRAVPPAPVRRRFPGIMLLLGMRDAETQSDRTPWWLLLIRTLAVAAVILGFAGPVLNPVAERGGTGPVLILLDGSWADAADWVRKQDRVEALLAEAARAGRPVAVAALTDPLDEGVQFRAADAWRDRVAGIQPRPWEPRGVPEWLASAEGSFDSWWLSDGLARESRAQVLAALEARGEVTVFEGGRNVTALLPPRFDAGRIELGLRRAVPGAETEERVLAYGPDPAGVERVLAEAVARFAPDETQARVVLAVPPEVRNRITRFQIGGCGRAYG